MGAFCFFSTTAQSVGSENVSRHCSASSNAVVNHDGDCLNGDGKCRHSGQDDPDPSEAVSEAVRIIGWKATLTSRFRVFLFVFLSAPLQRHQRQRQGA